MAIAHAGDLTTFDLSGLQLWAAALIITVIKFVTYKDKE
jgi:hypothetical protein